VVGRVEDKDFEDGESTAGGETEGTDLGGNFLQATSGSVVLASQRASVSKEGAGTGRDGGALGFTLLTGQTAAKRDEMSQNELAKKGRRTHEKHYKDPSEIPAIRSRRW
jgi:hypothetical protein